MPGITRIGDALSGHGCWGDHNIDAGSQNVFVNGIPASRAGDVSTAHCCLADCHTGKMSGSNSVFINGKSAQKVGDPVDCGSTQAAGSQNVFIGG